MSLTVTQRKPRSVRDKRLDEAHALLQDWADWTLRHVLEHPRGKTIEHQMREYGQAVGSGVFSTVVPDWLTIPSRLRCVDRALRKGVAPVDVRVMVFYRYLWRPAGAGPTTESERCEAWCRYSGRGRSRYFEIADRVLWYIVGVNNA